jgi:hypothetical protein
MVLDPVARNLRLPCGTPEFVDRITRGGVNRGLFIGPVFEPVLLRALAD